MRKGIPEHWQVLIASIIAGIFLISCIWLAVKLEMMEFPPEPEKVERNEFGQRVD